MKVDRMAVIERLASNFRRVRGAGCRNRTYHLMITNQLLYQMS